MGEGQGLQILFYFRRYFKKRINIVETEIRLFPKKGRPQGNIVEMEIRLFPKKGRPQGNIVETEIRWFSKK